MQTTSAWEITCNNRKTFSKGKNAHDRKQKRVDFAQSTALFTPLLEFQGNWLCHGEELQNTPENKFQYLKQHYCKAAPHSLL